MFDKINADDAEKTINDWQAGFEGRAAAARELAARMESITGSARSRDGLVEVTVGRSGELADLWLHEEIRHRSAARTAQEIRETASAARAVLARRVQEAVADTIGLQSETGKAVLKGYQTEDGGA